MMKKQITVMDTTREGKEGWGHVGSNHLDKLDTFGSTFYKEGNVRENRPAILC